MTEHTPPLTHGYMPRKPFSRIQYRYGIVLLGILMLALHPGCAVHPVGDREIQTDPDLRAIHSAFVRTVAAAHNSRKDRWHSGWLGNIRINTVESGRDRGLCFEWQRLVYWGVLPAVRRADWHATGIMINFGTRNEHHAVLVFDPRRVDQEELLPHPEGKPAWVLDAWRRGKPDVYRLEDWLKLPLVVRVPPRLTAVKPDPEITSHTLPNR